MFSDDSSLFTDAGDLFVLTIFQTDHCSLFTDHCLLLRFLVRLVLAAAVTDFLNSRRPVVVFFVFIMVRSAPCTPYTAMSQFPAFQILPGLQLSAFSFQF